MIYRSSKAILLNGFKPWSDHTLQDVRFDTMSDDWFSCPRGLAILPDAEKSLSLYTELADMPYTWRTACTSSG